MDTNFLIIPAQFKVDIFSEINRICIFNYDLCVLDKTIDELNNIIKKEGTKKGTYAKVALNIIKIKKIKVIATSKDEEHTHTDDILVDIADNGSYVVATQDKLLKKRLKDINQMIGSPEKIITPPIIPDTLKGTKPFFSTIL